MLPECQNRLNHALIGTPQPLLPSAPPAEELGPAQDNIRSTHWIGDNKLLLVSYIDKPNVE